MGLCNLGWPYETYPKLKSHEISFPHNVLISYPIIPKYCTGHGSNTVVFDVKFENDWINVTNVLDERDFTRRVILASNSGTSLKSHL